MSNDCDKINAHSAAIPIILNIQEQLQNGMTRGLFRVDDIRRKAENDRWDDWWDDSKEFWTKRGLLDNNGKMKEVTRNVILCMKI